MSQNIGRSILRRGRVTPNTPAGGAAASAVTVTGIVSPAGARVETAWGLTNTTPPDTGWGAATNGGGLAETWTRNTTRPAAGTWWLWARRTDWPRTVGVAVAPTVVT
ncbi:MAG TPA: hypothetical protein VGN96_11180 [Roseococcus sp.]|jgi:hypothetical protein|nr:hypothetical protein [Roseococcus sp.]